MKHFLRCLLYIAALGVVFFVVGRLVPKSWFKADHFPWRCYSYEQAIWKVLRVNYNRFEYIGTKVNKNNNICCDFATFHRVILHRLALAPVGN